VSYFSGTTGERITQLLDAIDFNDALFRQGGIQPDGTRNTTLDTGDAITIPNVDGDTGALSLIQQLLEAERGVFYISKDGKATYEERSSRARRTTSSATITTGALRSEPGFEFDQLVNRQSVTREFFTSASGTTPNVSARGTTQIAQNGVSARVFGIQDGSEITSGFIPSDAQALNLGQYIVNIRSTFVAPVVVELDAGDATTLTNQLALELQDRVSVSDAVAGTFGDYIVESIEHEITNGGNSFVTTFTLSEFGPAAIVFAADAATSPVVFAPPDGTVTYTECTSSSRPVSPTDGDYILETDTGRYYERDAGEWVEQIYPRLTY
jgi:hypothetical protein